MAKKSSEFGRAKSYARLFSGMISIVLALALYVERNMNIIYFVSAVIANNALITYCLFGYLKLYKIKYFKGHMIVRYFFLLSIILYIITTLVIGYCEDVDGMLLPWLYAILLLLCAIQGVINGYNIKRKNYQKQNSESR